MMEAFWDPRGTVHFKGIGYTEGTGDTGCAGVLRVMGTRTEYHFYTMSLQSG